MHNTVSQPEHYTSGSIECVDYIESMLTKEEFIGWLRGNIAKYLHRYKYKGKPTEDLEKAGWFIERLKLKEMPEPGPDHKPQVNKSNTEDLHYLKIGVK